MSLRSSVASLFVLPLFALTLFASACDADASDPGSGPGEGPDTPRSALPDAIVGDWFTGSLSSIQYYDQVTGEWQDPSGSGFYFILGADGSYETGAVIDSTVSGCTMRLLGTEVGTMTAEGDVLTVYRHWVKTHVTNTCGNDGERTQGQATSVLSWSVDVDENGLEWLSLTHDDGSVERYRRWER
ncbi:MAG: hypothetical protein U1F43_17205 [Myxococcota bacterium]